MANTTQDKLYETFTAIWGGQPAGVTSGIDAAEELTTAVRELTKTAEQAPALGGLEATIRGAASLDEGGRPASGTTPAGAAQSSSAEAQQPVASSEAAAPAVRGWGSWSASDATPSSSNAAASEATSSAESTASKVLQTVFSGIPAAGLLGSAAASGSSGGGVGSTLESIASTVLKSGLGVVPLIGGLLGLFGGGDSDPAPTPTKYTMPSAIRFEGADEGSGVVAMDSDQMGMPRLYKDPSSAASGNTGRAPSATAPQITVNVQAMDARSFLDRSGDIAAAVRDAMLNMNSINDVVNEL